MNNDKTTDELLTYRHSVRKPVGYQTPKEVAVPWIHAECPYAGSMTIVAIYDQNCRNVYLVCSVQH